MVFSIERFQEEDDGLEASMKNEMVAKAGGDGILKSDFEGRSWRL